MTRIFWSASTAIATVLAACAADFENEFVAVAFDGAGRLASLREKATGRELVREKVPFVTVTRADGSVGMPTSCAVGPNDLRFAFPDGECRLAVTPFPGGWTFQTVSMSVRDCVRLQLGRILPTCDKEKGLLSNIVMDDESAVVLRGYQPEIDMCDGNPDRETPELRRETYVTVGRKLGLTGRRYGLSAGPADRILEMLRGMAQAAGMTQTGCGGPWSLGSEANRRSYLMGTWMDMESADDWIRLMEKAGCRTFHLHAWWGRRGSYGANPLCFPNGYADMKEFVDRLHAAGRFVSTHSLSAVAQFGDVYIAPEWFGDFATDATYRLARPYRRGDTELWVTTKPDASLHSKIMSGDTNGNVLRLGDDLLQYDDFTTEPPYGFTGVHVAREPYGDAQTYDPTQAMGAEFASREGGTGRTRELSRAEYPAGTDVDYLHQRYAEFVARPGSRLAEELTDQLAWVFNTLELDGIYFDGAEAMGSRYAIDWMRERTIAKLRPRNGTVINSTSCRNPFNWWNRSLAGTWDQPTYCPRGFMDRHIRVFRDYARADFMQVDLGWWNAHAGSATSRGYFPEEQDYVSCKAAANDMTISLQGVRPTDGPLSFAADAQVTIFGKWERARYARAFRPGLQERMKAPGEDWRLFQDASGLWQAAPLECRSHRVATERDASWTVSLRDAGPAAVRVEALYAVDRSAKPVRVIDASLLGELRKDTQRGVTATAVAGHDPEHGATIRLSADNASAEPHAAWASLVRRFPEKLPGQFAPVSSLWIRGDGSGATLNVQMHGGCAGSENYVKLDFTGWRKFDLFLRERDADKVESFVWPYEPALHMRNPRLYMVPMNGRNMASVGFYLNGIPKGGHAEVEIGAWEAYPQRRGELTDAVVELNGRKLPVPFALAGGEFAELADGFWTRFAETGEPIERVASPAAPAVAKGANAVRYAGRAADGGFGRAEVTVFRAGQAEPAFVGLTDEQRKLMDVEYEMPVMLNPSKGLSGDVDVHVRPGERVAIRFEILGPAANPVVAGRRMSVTLRDSFDRVASYDGRTWQAVRITPGKCGPDDRTAPAKREVFAEGVFDEPLPVLSGGTAHFSVTAERADGARVTFFKAYEEEK